MSPLEQDIAAWNKREQRFGALFGQGALNDRGFLKIKRAELAKIYRRHRRTATSLEDKATLSMLRAGNRNMEKKLYPNRLVRYARRLGRSAVRGIKNVREGITARREERRLRVQQWNNPGVIFSNNGKITTKPAGSSASQQMQPQEKSIAPQPTALLPRKYNHERTAEELRKKGLGI